MERRKRERGCAFVEALEKEENPGWKDDGCLLVD